MQAQNLTRTQVPLKIQQAACSTTQNMQYLIQYTHNASSWKKQQAADKCEAEHPGYYYTPAGKCLPKQCYCTIELGRRAGTRGVDCPENGKTDCEGCCTPQQRSPLCRMPRSMRKPSSAVLLKTAFLRSFPKGPE